MPTEFRKQADARRREQRREDLLDAATVVFGRKGYHGALVSDIVEQAGVGQGTFYRYFRGKPEIFEALFDRFVESVFSEFSEMTLHMPRSLGEYRDASVAAMQRVAARVENDRELLLLVVRDGPVVGASMEEKLSAFYDGLASLARTYLEHAVREGFARPCNAAAVSQALVGMGFWLARQWWSGRLSGVERERLIEEMVDFAFLGFGQPVGRADGGSAS